MLILETDSDKPLYMQIYNQYREAIISGDLLPGIRLPSTRTLAKNLNVSRNTIESAYQQLCSEGYIVSKAGSGYKVQIFEPALLKGYKDQPSESSIGSKIIHEQGVSVTEKYNFQYGRLSASDFPLRVWKKLINQVFTSKDIDCVAAYNDRKGELGLRIEIMKYLNDSRGVKCEPEQIILCSGTLYCLSLICQLLMKKSTEIAVEEPCYESARNLFLNHGFKVNPVPLQEDGIDLSMINKMAAKAIYTTPSHQFPMGTVMTINKRLGLIEWAEKNDAFIIEDDYDSELRYNSRPIPSMQSFDSKGRVIYTNTFSKSFAPGLRMSFMVLPPALLEEYRLSFHRYNCTVPWLEQTVMYHFMHEGYWNRHLRKICISNKKKHDTLVQTINKLMGDRVKIHGKNAGLHIILEVNNGLTERELINKAHVSGVTVYPVSNHWADRNNYSNNMVLIGFSGLTETEIIEGINLLYSAWF